MDNALYYSINRTLIVPRCIYCKEYIEDTPEAGMTSDFNYYHADCEKESQMDKWDDIYYNGEESYADIGD